MATVLDLMLAVNNSRVQIFYHKDTKRFDGMPISSIEWENIDKDSDALIPFKDENNFRFLSYEEINHKELMSFYVHECVVDKATRKKLFDVLRRHEYVDLFIETLKSLELYEEYIMFAGDVYDQMFEEWAKENGLEF